MNPTDTRGIAREAYVYGFPMVDNLRIQHAYFVDPASPDYKAPYNHLAHVPRVFTPADRSVQTPNSDTPYSFVGLDLRAEPFVFTVPPVSGERYWSIQFIDLYTHNFAYVGTRATGNTGGNFMVAGPGWSGDPPPGVHRLIRCETELAVCLLRTQLFSPEDLPNVQRIQSGYRAVGLSSFLGLPPPPPLPAPEIPPPLSVEEQKHSLQFFANLDAALRFAPVHPDERALRARLSRIGLGRGQAFDVAALSPEQRAELQAGMADAWGDCSTMAKQVQAGAVTSGECFGTREFLRNDYLKRMTAAVLGIYGNSREEALYPTYYLDGDGRPLDGRHRYVMRFGPGALPPVDAFWSLTAYSQPDSLLVANPLGRYLLNSTMMSQLKQDPDGGLSLVLQADSPGAEWETNWLPVPRGPFSAILRLYLPRPEAQSGRWRAPALIRSG